MTIALLTHGTNPGDTVTTYTGPTDTATYVYAAEIHDVIALHTCHTTGLPWVRLTLNVAGQPRTATVRALVNYLTTRGRRPARPEVTEADYLDLPNPKADGTDHRPLTLRQKEHLRRRPMVMADPQTGLPFCVDCLEDLPTSRYEQADHVCPDTPAPAPAPAPEPEPAPVEHTPTRKPEPAPVMRRPTYADDRRRTYNPNDRVQIYAGQIGRVVKVVHRNDPPFAGYLIDTGHGEPIEVPSHQVGDPQRYLLERWREWSKETLGDHFIAWLSDAHLAQLQAEYIEENPRARREPWSRYVPHRTISRDQALHLVTVAKRWGPERYKTKSNGSCGRYVRDPEWWISCMCGFRSVQESASDAKRRRLEHEQNPAADAPKGRR